MWGSRSAWWAASVIAILAPLGAASVTADTGTAPSAHDATLEANLDFIHAPSSSDLPRYPDFMGGGACWGDHDGDGRLDLFLTNTLGPDSREHAALYRNEGPDENGTWRFRDVSRAQGVDLQGVGQGCIWGDYDNDGRPDLFVTYAVMAGSARGHSLLRNLGHGQGFEDVTVAAGMDLQDDTQDHDEEEALCLAVHKAPDGASRTLCFGVSAAWLDHDLDGDLDLYVGNYVEVPYGSCRFTAFPNPIACQGQRNHLWRNEGDGTFTEVAESAGVAWNSDPSGGRTLGVVATDIDGDGWPDLYVANDYDSNALYINQRDGTFIDMAAARGVDATGYARSDENGHRAGMGIDAQDLDDDGHVDLLSTHLRDQYDAIYMGDRHRGAAVWNELADESTALSTIATGQSRWGGGFVDLDLDGHKDYLVVTGNQYNHEPGPIHLAHQIDGELVLSTAPAWPFGQDSPDTWLNHRGAAFADYDNDGDMDVLVGVLEHKDADPEPARPRLLRFDVVPPSHATAAASADAPHYLRLVLNGTDSTRDAFGAHVVVQTADGHRQHIGKTSGASYASGHDPRLLFGLGDQTHGTLTVTWPGGKTQGPIDFDLAGETGLTLGVEEPNTRAPPEPTWHDLGADGILRWAPSLAADFAAYRLYAQDVLVAEIGHRGTTEHPVDSAGPFRVTVVDTAGHESGSEGDGSAFLPAPGVTHLVSLLGLTAVMAARLRR